MRCPRCSSPVGPEQDWCLECGAPARTRLAPTPNWQLPTIAIAAIVALAGALLAFAFVKLTSDDNLPAGTTPTAVVETAPPVITPPPVVTPPPATSTAPAQPTVPSTAVPGQTTPTTTAPPVTTTGPAATTPTTPTTTPAPTPRPEARTTPTPPQVP